MLKRPFLIYFSSALFIFGWWYCFQPSKEVSCIASKNGPYQVANALFLEPIPRDDLHKSLSGDFKKMVDLIVEWDLEAALLIETGYSKIERLSSDDFREAILLFNSIKSIKNELRIIPQTHVAATILMALAPQTLVALPMGLRMNQDLFSNSDLTKISKDCQSLDGETTYRLKPDLAFVASYSNPVFLNMLKKLHIPQVESSNIQSIENVLKTIEEVASYSDHPKEGRLLSLFTKGAYLAVDNRLNALKETLNKDLEKALFIFGDRQFYSPDPNSLTGEMLNRLGMTCFGKTMTIEEIELFSPNLVISANMGQEPKIYAKKVVSVNQTVQDSPTQFAALAYRDLAACLMEALMHE